MTIDARCLVQAKYAENSQTTQYTSTAARTIIDKVSLLNVTGSAVTFAANLVASAGSAATTNLVMSRTIAANASDLCPELVGHVLNPGDFLSTLAGTASALVLRVSGRLIT